MIWRDDFFWHREKQMALRVVFLDEIKLIFKHWCKISDLLSLPILPPTVARRCSPLTCTKLNAWAAAGEWQLFIFAEFISSWINKLNLLCWTWGWQEEDAGVWNRVAGSVCHGSCELFEWLMPVVNSCLGYLHEALKWYLSMYSECLFPSVCFASA